jgi:hypothetical protein
VEVVENLLGSEILLKVGPCCSSYHLLAFFEESSPHLYQLALTEWLLPIFDCWVDNNRFFSRRWLADLATPVTFDASLT